MGLYVLLPSIDNGPQYQVAPSLRDLKFLVQDIDAKFKICLIV